MKDGVGNNWLNGVPADGERLLDRVRAMPNTDLNFATLSSGNTDYNAWRDHVYWAEAVQPFFVAAENPVRTMPKLANNLLQVITIAYNRLQPRKRTSL
jgi:hypothetical protein